MTRLIALSWLSALSLVLSPVAQVDASCAPHPPSIVWSYPAAGATDVPVDTDFFVLLEGGERPSVMFHGGSQGSWDGGNPWDGGRFNMSPLDANTEYTAEVTARGVTFEIRFTTGTTMAPANVTPTLTSYVVDDLAQPMTPHTCAALLHALDCFDTGQDSVVRLMPTGEATLWLVESTGPGADGGGQPRITAWPGECGAPPMVLRREQIGVDPPCVRVTSVSASGAHLYSQELCLDSGSKSGCAVSPSRSGGGAAGCVVGLAAVAHVLRRRRRQRS